MKEIANFNKELELQNIPQELKTHGLWCGWKLTSKGKVPFNVRDGSLAKSNDPTTFANYGELLDHAHEFICFDEEGAMVGGIGLGIFRGFSAIDIDHCVDDEGRPNPFAKEIIEFIDSYTEYSPSRHGIRIIFKTNIKIDKVDYYINNRDLGLEIYISDNTNKFVTITGNALSDINAPIKECNIQPLLDKYMRKGNPLQTALKKDSKLIELWNAVASGSGGNESETDMALCCKLAFYLKGDFDAIDEAFRSSPYFASKDDKHRDKWIVRNDYRLMTINNAINMVASCPNDYSYLSVTKKAVEGEKKTYDLSDTGNARRFVDKYGKIIRYNVDNRRWMIFNGKYWENDYKNLVKSFAEIVAEEARLEAWEETDIDKKKEKIKNAMRMFNSAGKENMLKEAQHQLGIAVFNKDFDANPYLLCCENGVVDLRTGQILKHSPELMCSKCTGCEIDLDHEPILFNKFMQTTYEGDEDLIDYVEQFLGYALTGTTREQALLQLYGEGRNGKSLLLEVMSKLAGTYCTTSDPSLICQDRWGNCSDKSELARLNGARIVIVQEPRSNDRMDEAVIKDLTSGLGEIKACFKYANPFTFHFIGKILIATNYLLITKATDYGFWRRQHLVKHNHVITDEEDDKDLIIKLEREIPQILGLLVKKCIKYFKIGHLIKPKKTEEWLKEYKEEMDVVEQWLQSCCVRGEGVDFYTSASKLYDSFIAFARKNKEYEMTATMFGRNMSKKFIKKRIGGGNIYIGVKIRTQAEDLTKKIEYDNVHIKDEEV